MILGNVVQKTIPKPRDLNPEIPEALEKIMQKALERSVSRRYQDAGKMGYDLEYFMYHKGYGPTIVTLEKYMRQLFPRLYVAPSDRSFGDTVPIRKPTDAGLAATPAPAGANETTAKPAQPKT